MSELKPCPFCGGEAHYWLDTQYQDRHVIECDDCGCNRRYEYSKEGVEKEWNTRADVWINIDEQLPKIGQECLIEIPVCAGFNIENGRYKGNGAWVGAWCSERGNGCCYKVSRWMPR